jgi:hypothetical protein
MKVILLFIQASKEFKMSDLVHNIIDDIESEISEIQIMYLDGSISLAELNDMCDYHTDLEKINFKLETRSDKELAEKLITAILEVYNL